MTQFSNDNEFKAALAGLSPDQQRAVGALFVENVAALSNDERIAKILRVAKDGSATADDLAAAYKSANSAAIDSHTRCGAESDWNEQAGYFVARAASALVATPGQAKGGSPAWQAAMNSRMARTCVSINTDEETAHHQESEAQYRLLAEFMNA